MKKYQFLSTLILFLVTTSAVLANGKVNVVATLPDLAYIAREVGGQHVEVSAIAKGYQDPHFVDAKPSFVLKLKQAELFIQIGLDLEVGWVPPLLETARNKDIYFGGEGYLNASEDVRLLEVPNVDPAQLRAQGDIHIYGNPHYWLDPLNGKIIAQNIATKLSNLRPELTPVFEKNVANFSARVDSALQVWQNLIAPYKGTKIIAYHNSWPYFEKRFEIEIAGFIEPKPGIPPSPSHLVEIIASMQEQNIKTIIISPYFDAKPAESVADRTDAVVIRFAPSVGAFSEVKTYFDLFDYNIRALVDAFEQQNVSPNEMTQ